MSNPNPNPATRFKPVLDTPLERKVTGVKLPVVIGEAVRALPPEERSAWLRRVISEAVERELLGGDQQVSA